MLRRKDLSFSAKVKLKKKHKIFLLRHFRNHFYMMMVHVHLIYSCQILPLA